MATEPELTAATVIHHCFSDLLFQKKFAYAHFPEIVDLAVIGTGLGTLQSSFSFVKQSNSFWDSTFWDVFPRPFLDTNALAYANAIAAWVRGDRDPEWANELPAEVKRPMKKSLKYLFKTEDSFFHPSTAGTKLLEQSQEKWIELANQSSVSKQVVAVRGLVSDDQLGQQQEALLLDKLRSPDRVVVLNSITAVTSLKLNGPNVVDELKLLAENRDDETRAKAIMALTHLDQLDEMTIGLAAKMVSDHTKFVSFAGVFALSSLETVREPILRAAEGGLLRALQSCDYEFIGIYATALTRWLDDPRSHVENLLQDDEPGYLKIMLDALDSVQEKAVSLG